MHADSKMRSLRCLSMRMFRFGSALVKAPFGCSYDNAKCRASRAMSRRVISISE